MQKRKGVSLIVLVITVIVMVILAGAIILTLNNSGIIQKSSEAVNKTNEAALEEQINLAKAEALMTNYLNNDGLSLNELQGFEDKIEEYNLSGNNYVYNNTIASIVKDGNASSENNGVPIPVGFAHVSGTEVDTGLIIVDGEGNEFVWVPVEDIDDFVRKPGYANNELQVLRFDTVKHFTEPRNYDDGLVTETNDVTGEYAEFAAMIQSVEIYGGFYIGRYETGTTIERTVANPIGTSVKDDGTPDVLVQKDKFVYNLLGWGPSTTQTTGDVVYNNKNRGKGAVELSRGLYPKEGKQGAVSTLIYGVQWDAAIEFVSKSDPEYRKNSKNGNYGYTLQKTGYNKMNNIYDMGGNVWEYTMESYGSSSRTYRGGGYNVSSSGTNTSTSCPASTRSTDSPYKTSLNKGFRIALYVK